MKKIVGAVAMASLLAGAASAADISFSYTGSNYFKSSGGNLSFDERTDCMALEIKSETSGVVLDFDTTDGLTLAQDEYYGWMTFALPAGNLQLTAGVWNGRYVNRVNTDAGDLDGEDFELYKPGVINGAWGEDSENLTERKSSTVAAYTNDDLLPGKLFAKFGLVKSTWDPTAKSATTATSDGDVIDSDSIFNAGFVGEAAYRQEGLIDMNFAVKSHVAKQTSYGIFVSPLMVENLEAMVGFTFAGKNAWSAEAGKQGYWKSFNKEFAIDLRARYQFSDTFSMTTMHNISCFYDSNADDNGTVLWDMINASFKMAEKLTIGCTANFTFDIAKSSLYRAKNDYDGFDLVTSPYLAIQATEKVAVTTAVRIEALGINPHKDGNESFDITVPVIFSFNY